jgi:glutathione S-transferase
MPELTLYSARACPFAHRTRLVLAEKKVDFELVEIDLANKPSWFGTVSGYGKVPAIHHGDVRLWESAVINEYLDEVFPVPRLLPSEPALRARARIWIDFANTQLVSSYGASLRGKTEGERAAARDELQKHLAFLENEGLAKLSGEGPFFLGATPSLVDFTLFPWFERWPALQELRQVSIPKELTRLARWIDAVAALPSAKSQANPASFYIERYAKLFAPKAVAS